MTGAYTKEKLQSQENTDEDIFQAHKIAIRKEERKNLMASIKHEDAIMKMGFDYFRDTILKTLGIDYHFVEPGVTELVELIIHSLYMDLTFLTTEDFYIHIEFQTTDKGEPDLRRFHAYEAVYSNKTGKKVITYVIYSGGIQNTKSELDCGAYTYRVRPIYLTAQDSDKVFLRLKEKIKTGEKLTEEDFAELSLTPLMSGNLSRKETIREAICLAKQEKSITSEKTMAMLYALADKFLKGKELEEIKEAISMTRLGQMIFDDGEKAGIEKGIAAGKENMLKEKVKKKLQKNKPVSVIAEELEEDEENIRRIIEKIEAEEAK